jgi:hypothetical protein
MDVDSIDLGRDFREVLQERLQSCDQMLVLIGPHWLDAKDAAGNRRLDQASDFVRQEIAAALKRKIPVTPILVQGAQMPAPEQLPEELKDLAFRNGFELSHNRWQSDIHEMVRRLGLRTAEVRPNSPGAGPVGHAPPLRDAVVGGARPLAPALHCFSGPSSGGLSAVRSGRLTERTNRVGVDSSRRHLAMGGPQAEFHGGLFIAPHGVSSYPGTRSIYVSVLLS